MSDTPRTDAAILPHYAGAPGVDIETSRQIERELAAAEKDAERYRWWRVHVRQLSEHAAGIEGWSEFCKYGSGDYFPPEQFDAAIDAAKADD